MVDDTRQLYADIVKQLSDLQASRGVNPIAERMALAAPPQPVRNPFSGTGVRNPSAAGAWVRGSGLDAAKGVNLGLQPDVAQDVINARRVGEAMMQNQARAEALRGVTNFGQYMQGVAEQPTYLKSLTRGDPSSLWMRAGEPDLRIGEMRGPPEMSGPRLPSGARYASPIGPTSSAVEPADFVGPRQGLRGYTQPIGPTRPDPLGVERYNYPIGPEEMRGPSRPITAGAKGARALMGKAASMYTPAAVAAGLTGSAMDLFDPESDVRTWGASGRADFYRDLNEGNYLRAAGDFARANLMSGAAVAKNVAGAVLPVGPALDVLAGLVGGQRAQAQEVPEAQLPEQDGFILRNDNIPEEARLNGGLNFIGTVGPGGSQVTAEDIQGAYDRLNKQNRLAQVMDSLSGPQQREMLAYGAKQQRPMSWSDKLSQQLAGAIAANVAEQLQAEKDPAKRNAIKRQGLLELSRLAGRGNVQLENIGALPMMQED